MLKLLSLFTLVLLPAISNAETRYERVERIVNEVHKANPSNTKVFRLPTYVNESLIGIEIGDGNIEDLIVATHHGNEYGSTELALALIQSFAQKQIPGRKTVIIPVINVSGYNANQRGEHGYDPNRDWEGPCGNAHGTPFQLKSISAVRDFIARRNFIMAITLHTYHPSVTYPWGGEENSVTDHTSEFAQIASLAVQHNNYYTGTSANVIYPARGIMEDYVFWRHGVWGFLFELGTSHNPTSEDIKKIISDNVPAITSMLTGGPTQRATKTAFKGKCTDWFIQSLLDLHDE